MQLLFSWPHWKRRGAFGSYGFKSWNAEYSYDVYQLALRANTGRKTGNEEKGMVFLFGGNVLLKDPL
ncbi:MAG: hypothetical protein HFF97_04900 [Oscillibacter sp.]|nr:hypothetical protein [Oscillibacter sp.]